MLDTWLNATETGRTEAFDALGRQLEQARARHEGAKALDEALFGQDFEAGRQWERCAIYPTAFA